MKTIFTLLFASPALMLNAQPFTGLYTFANVSNTSGLTDPTPPPTATGLTFGSFNAVGTPPNPNANGRFSFVNWATGSTDGDNNFANLAGTRDTGEYYQVTLTPNTGFAIDISAIGFTVQRSAFGIRTWVVRSSLDGYSTNLPASINPSNNNLSVQGTDTFFWNFDSITTAQNGSTIVPGVPFTGITAPVTFRFYAWNSEAGTGTFSIDNVVFNGTANSITIDAEFTASDYAVCDGTPVQFTDASQSFNGPIIVWNWNFGDPASGPNNTSTQQNPSHTFSSCGTYTVTLIVVNANSDADTTTSVINVFCNPTAAFSGTPLGACGQACVNFTDNSTGSPITWSWDFGDLSTDTMPDPSHCYTNAGSYDVVLVVTDANGCSDADTMNNYITVFPDVVADFSYTTAGLTANFTDLTSGGTGPYTYVFDPGDGSPVQNTVPASHTYPFDNAWTACLIVTDANGCVDTTCYVINVVSTGISANALPDAFVVFPNPSANGLFNITWSNYGQISVYDLLGTLVHAETISAASVLDLSSQPSGTYFVKLVAGNNVFVEMVIRK